jgi:MprA protease rhombosortase-interaction domain-containing protein
VPPEDLDGLITDLGATVGRVSGRTQETTDVTDQLVDLDIRIAVERDVITRFRSLLDDADEFQDIVDIERVIGERTIALEQLLASQRNLEDRVELSTLTIELRYEATPLDEPVVEDDAIDGIGDAWRAGWDVFVGALFAIGFVLAVAAPFVAVVLLVAGAVGFAVRRRRDSTADLPASSEPSDDSDVRPPEQLAEPSRRG